MFQCQNFEVLDARIASALNKIIHNSHFKRRISLEEQKAQKQDRFCFRGRQIGFLDLWVTSGSQEPMILSRIMRPIHYWSSKWLRNSIIDDTNPSDDILEGLHKLIPRVWETQDRIGIVWPGDSSEEVWTWLSQIEDNGKKKHRAEIWELRIFEARNGNYERNALVKNQETKNSVTKEVWEIVGRVWEMHREPEVLEAEAPVVECPRWPLARITSKELAPLHSVKSAILQSACSTS